MEALTSFYLDRGYINFEIDSHDVSISQNKQDIYVTISIIEGEPYIFGKVQLDDTQHHITQEEFSAVKPKSGEPFSRRQVLVAKSALKSKLTDIGFAFNGEEYELVADTSFWQQPWSMELFLDKINQIYASELLNKELKTLGFVTVSYVKTEQGMIDLVADKWID